MKSHSFRLFYVASTIFLNLMMLGCTRKIDYREIVEINGLVYKINDADPFTGVVKNYSTGKFLIISTGNCDVVMQRGKLEGRSICYYQNGNKMLEVNYKQERKDGIEKKWNDEGHLESEIEWSNGQKNGVEKIFNVKNDQMIVRINWKNGKKEGRENAWELNGKNLMVDLDWVDGKATGYRNDYDVEYVVKNGVYQGVVKYYRKDELTGVRYLYFTRVKPSQEIEIEDKFNVLGKLEERKEWISNVLNRQIVQDWDGEKMTARVEHIRITQKNSNDAIWVRNGKELISNRDNHGLIELDYDWDRGVLVRGLQQRWNDGKLAYSCNGVFGKEPNPYREIVKDGVEKEWDISGQLTLEASWDKGVLKSLVRYSINQLTGIREKNTSLDEAVAKDNTLHDDDIKRPSY